MTKLLNLNEKIKKNNFLIIGRAGIDIYPDPPGSKIEKVKKFVSFLGGSSANIAVQLRKLGCNCKILTRVSNDSIGKFVINELNKNHIDNTLVRIEGGESRTSVAIVESTIKDHQTVIYRNQAADLFMNQQDIINAKIKNFSCIIFTGTCLASEPSRSAIFLALKIANKNNIPVIQDIDYRPYTWKSPKEASKVYLKAAKLCNVLIGNDLEFGILAMNYNKGLSLAKNLSNKVNIVIYKKGEKGSITFESNKKISKGIYKVKALKPTGAGDAFMGGLVGSIVNNYSLNDSIEIASAAAAIVVTKVGCSPAMPNMKEIKNFMKKNKIRKG